MTLYVAVLLTVGACSNAVGTPTTAEADTAGGSVQSVVLGATCDTPGELGLTGDGQTALCSGSGPGPEYALLDAPAWRLTAGGTPSAGHTESEQRAINLVRGFSLFQSDGDDRILVMLQEYTAAVRKAADIGFPPDQGFANLSTGLATANDLSTDIAVAATTTLLRAAQELLSPDEPAHSYIDRMLAFSR